MMGKEQLPGARRLYPVKNPSLYEHAENIGEFTNELLIKMSGQGGGLGISIAGGTGSLPYKDNNEGIFISRVKKGGPAEKAGVHIGDRIIEVNGQDMKTVSHHEAVSALRSAGNCIKVKVLRQKDEPEENQTTQEVSETEALFGCKNIELDPGLQVKRIEAVIRNGKSLSSTRSEKETLVNSRSLQGGKHTMMIPRIILTHPSTSDEDVEALTHSNDIGDDDDPDSHICSDLNNAFYPL